MFIAVLILSCIYGGKTKYVAYINQNRNMLGAATFCAEECGGSLLSIDDRTVAVLSDIVPFDVQVFVGYHTTQSKWIEIYGCFKHNENHHPAEKMKTYSDPEYKILQKDEKGFAASCQLFCDPLVYIAKMGSTCLCFKRSPSSPRADSRKCHSKNRLFNTEDGYAMYFRAHNVSMKLDDLYCSYVKCYHDGIRNKFRYYKDRCTADYMSFCFDVQGTYRLSLTFRMWKDNLLKCIKYGWYLSRATEEPCRYAYINTPYWDGSFKYQGLVLDRDQKLSVFTNYTKCGYILRTTLGIDLILESCTKDDTYTFMCEYESMSNANNKCKNNTLSTIKETTTESKVSTTNSTTRTIKSTVETTDTTETTFKTEFRMYEQDTTVTIDTVIKSNITEIGKRPEVQQNTEPGIIVGAAIGVLLLVTLLVLAVIIILRKKKQKIVEATKTKQETNAFNMEVEYRNVNNATVDNVTVKVNSARHNNDSSAIRANTEKKHSNLDDGESFAYEFAKPLNSNDNETVPNEERTKEEVGYIDLKEGEYDHLGNTRKRKEELVEQILYDHAMGTTQRNSDIYDHTTATAHDSFDIYDHTITNSTNTDTDLYDHTVI